MKQTKAQLHTELIEQVKELYAKNDKMGVVEKTELAVELGLAMGCSSYMMITTMIDLGVRPEEVGAAVCLALMRTDDKYLNEIDRIGKIEAKKVWEQVT